MKLISVAIENTTVGMDRLYTYKCTEDISVGDCVSVPFGAGNKRRTGFVFDINESSELEEEKIKPAFLSEKAVLTEEAVQLCVFLKEKYSCRYIDAVKCFMPSGYFMYENILSIADEEKAKDFVLNEKSPRRQKQLTEILLKSGPQKKSVLKKNHNIDYSVMKGLVNRGIAAAGRIEKKRLPYSKLPPRKEGFDVLTGEQEKAFAGISEAVEAGSFKTFLLHGVTGSGKTRLYMESVRKALEKGRTAIILVPEISLSIQLIERFRGEFGSEDIAVIHSRISDGEKYDEWMRIKRGEVRIVLGARSALFAPLNNIGVIVLDEEHESSYKADNSPKYDTREVAEERAKHNKAVVILGSATPSVTTFYKSETGEIERLSLFKRYNATELPKVFVSDMREELRRGNKNIFSVKLYEEMKRCLSERKQIILFLNRRGYSSFVSCRACGYAMKCPECGVSMVYHKNENRVVCHYCGRTEKMPEVCPECGSRYIKDFGIGTEKVEEITKRLFPEAVVDRLDLDSVRRKGSAEKILSDFRMKKTDILVGTQLVAKGLDFDGVDLVGIIAADISLNIPDYRSSEKSFQLITQAAGRAGRGDKRGTVVVQTYSPDHYAIEAAARHDYNEFYRQEIALRGVLSYPPFGSIFQVVFLDESEEKAKECACEFAGELKKRTVESEKYQILDPIPSHILKIGGRYRYRVLIKYSDRDESECMKILEETAAFLMQGGYKSSYIGIEVNPYSFA